MLEKDEKIARIWLTLGASLLQLLLSLIEEVDLVLGPCGFGPIFFGQLDVPSLFKERLIIELEVFGLILMLQSLSLEAPLHILQLLDLGVNFLHF